MKQYECFELRYKAEPLADAWATVDLKAVFICSGETRTVKGFYDGDGSYVIRFLPMRAGTYRWKVSGIIEDEGEAVCEASSGKQGPVRAVDTHFEYATGEPFYPFGTTVYALAHQEDEMVEETLRTLSAAPFNKVRMCVFPKHYDYNNNEPPYYAFEKKADGGWDVNRPCIAFWHRFEDILDRICAMDIQVDLILFHPYDNWGFDNMPQADNLVYLDYLLRRLAAKPGIWWSLANEYDLSRRKTLADWEEIEGFVADHDPYKHLLSCHNCFCFWDATRPAVTHASIQTKVLTETSRWIEEYRKPVIIDECSYEGNLSTFWGSISAREMVNRFWRCFATGAYCTHGETFLDEHDVLWWAKGGVLKGKSPERIAFLRSVMEELPGPLTPVPGMMDSLEKVTAANLEATLAAIPKEVLPFAGPACRSVARMKEVDKIVHMRGEHLWASHCGDEAFLWFNDLQCFGEQTLELPEGRRYRVEWIDTWEMTRTTAAEAVSGTTTIRLPGREGIAVLAIRTDR